MIHQSPYPSFSIPPVTVPDFVLAQAERFGEHPAFIDAATDRSLSFAELARGVPRLAAGLASRGFRPGDVFAILAPNVIEYPLAYLGAARAGGTVSTLNPLATEDEATALLREAGARYLLTVPSLLDKAIAAAKRAGVEEVLVLGDAPGATPFAALFSSGPVPTLAIDPARDLVSLPFSSGTSGRPKGVMLTHSNLLAQVLAIDAVARVPAGGERVMVVLPYFHIYGLAVILLVHLWKGNTQVVMSRFDLEPFLEAMARHRITWAPLVPPIMLAMAKHPAVDRYDLSALRVVMSGAAPLGGDVESAAASRLKCLVVQGYGMTELSGASHLTPFDATRVKRGSVGFTTPNLEVRLVDPETGRDLGTKERGELWIRGPTVMRGYLNQPEATAATLVDGGWLRTGDVAYVDGDGYFYIVDRLKELIKYKGYQVAPADLEALLVTHPAIADAAVIPSADDEAGEVPKAFVVLRQPLEPEAIMAFVAERVAPYEKVRRVEVVDAIPKSPSGKILRRLLVERERASQAARPG
jgi:acyl-CoA synthetase (AMP-forming)/AMP-acid ligase II